MLTVGPKAAMEAAASYGIRSPLQAVPSAVLGTNPVTPIDMASAYSTFANRGVAVPPVLVTRITRADGTVLYAQEHTQKRVLSPNVADTLTAILEQVVQRGTGTAAGLSRPAAGKTGTADNHHDAWFVGYTPQLTTAVWVGFNKGQIPMEPPRTKIAVTGGTYPAQIWQRYMTAAHDGAARRRLPPGPGRCLLPHRRHGHDRHHHRSRPGLLRPVDRAVRPDPGLLRPHRRGRPTPTASAPPTGRPPRRRARARPPPRPPDPALASWPCPT